MKMLNISFKKKMHCEICNETFKGEAAFLKHIKSHIDFICPKCNEHFTKEKTRDIHVKMKFCEEGVSNHEKELFEECEKINNRHLKKTGTDCRNNGTMSYLFKKQDSKKKRVVEKIMEEHILDSYLLDDN